MGRGVDYKYPHAYENAWVEQQYLPDPLIGKIYYEPKPTSKFETALAKQYLKFNSNKK